MKRTSKKTAAKRTSRKTKSTYSFRGGQLFLGGGLDVEVSASSPAEARAKVRAALDKLRVNLSETKRMGDVRVSFDVGVTEAILGDE